MKLKHLLTTIVLFILSASSYSQWEPVNTPGYSDVHSFVKSDSALFIGTSIHGIMVTYDNGLNWISKNEGIPSSNVISICNTGSVLLAGVQNNGIYKSTNNGDSWIPTNSGITNIGQHINDLLISNDTILAALTENIYYSTDNGNSWNEANGIGGSYALNFTKFNSVIFASTIYDGVYKSLDNGVNWTKVISLTDNNIRGIASNNSYIYSFSQSYLYISSDTGNTWQTINVDLDSASYNSIFVVDSNVYIGTYLRGIYHSSDNGQTWSTLNNGMKGAYIYSFYTDSSGFYVGTANTGVLYSSDNGDNWQYRSNGFKNIEPLNIEADYPDIFATGYSSTYHSANDGNTWEFLLNDSDIVSDYFKEIIKRDNKIYTSSDYGFSISEDNGNTWEIRNTGLPSTSVCRLALSGDDIIAYVDSFGVYITENEGLLWSAINNGLPTTNISTFIEANDSVIYIGYNGGGAYKSYDKGQTWNSIVFTGAPYKIDIKDSVIIKAAYGIKISYDYGHTWTNYNISTYITSVATNGTDFFFAADTKGIYKLFGSTWVPINAGYEIGVNKNVLDIDANDSVVYIGTEKSGILKRDIANMSINKFTGNVYLDDNNNGIKDSNEVGFPNIIINTKQSNGYSVSDNNGDYTIYTNVFGDTLRAINNYNYATVTPQFYEVTTTDTAKNFGFYIKPNVNELAITLSTLQSPSPGFTYYLYITYKNNGTTTLDGTIYLSPDGHLDYISANQSPIFLNNDSIIWEFSNLSPLEERTIIVLFDLPTNINLGTSIGNGVTIFPIQNDTVPSNNHYSMKEIVIGSVDPNDKKANPELGISLAEIANHQAMEYTIRFQNTGTDTAHTVIITDTIEDKLNMQTFSVLSSSHNYHYTINNRVVNFIFDNILLPDSNTNETESHGFVKYSIEAQTNLILDDYITNTAYIYFDYNEAVITNTTSTQVIEQSYVKPLTKIPSEVYIYPNPTSNIFTVISKNIIEIELINSLGTTVLKTKKNKIDISNLPNGIYFIKIKFDNSSITKKIIKQ